MSKVVLSALMGLAMGSSALAAAELVQVKPQNLLMNSEEATPCLDALSASMGWCQMNVKLRVVEWDGHTPPTPEQYHKFLSTPVLAQSRPMTENRFQKTDVMNKYRTIWAQAFDGHKYLIVDTKTGKISLGPAY